jgi:hypothetical protein
MGRRVVVRILGVASTAKGFAYAVTEGPARLVSWGLLRTSSRRIPETLENIVVRMRPLFVAFDTAASGRKRIRGRLFGHFLGKVCIDRKLMLLPTQARHAVDLGRVRPLTRWQIASAMAGRFRELAHKLPEKRNAWRSEDDRMGIFMALATSVAAWRNFSEGSPSP